VLGLSTEVEQVGDERSAEIVRQARADASAAVELARATPFGLAESVRQRDQIIEPKSVLIVEPFGPCPKPRVDFR